MFINKIKQVTNTCEEPEYYLDIFKKLNMNFNDIINYIHDPYNNERNIFLLYRFIME
jgi:hypothetical protein